MENVKNYLNEKIEELKSNLEGWAIDFVNDSPCGCFDDAIWEFADNNTSIYYYQQFKYYEENTEDCENALIEYYGSEKMDEILKENTLYQLCCKAGAMGEFESIRQELWDSKEDILKVLLLQYIYNNETNYTIEIINDIVENGEFFDVDNIDEMYEYWRETFDCEIDEE